MVNYFSRHKKYFLLCIILLIIIWEYKDLPRTFYQQDEWLGFGQIVVLGWKSIFYNSTFLQLLFADGRPLTRILASIIFQKLTYNTLPLAIYSIGFHLINTFLVFKIAEKIIKKSYVALIAASVFGLSSISHQSISWFAASFGQQPAALLVFLSIYLFLLFLEKNKKSYIYLSFASAILSLYFKEIGIFLFAFLPLLPFIFKDKKSHYSVRSYLKLYIPLIIFVGIFVIYRLILMLVIRADSTSVMNTSVFATVSGGKTLLLETLLTRSIFYPITSFALIYIPQEWAIDFSYVFTRIYYPFIIERFDLVAQTVVLDLLATLTTAVGLAIIYICQRIDKTIRKSVVFSFVLYLLSIIPYLVIAKGFAYMEPRYYYISLLASSILFAVVVYVIVEKLSRGYFFAKIIAVFLVAMYLSWHIQEVQHDITVQVTIANERRHFLSQLTTLLPTLHQSKNIFLFTSDTHWLADNNQAPFQNGFGYTVMVVYSASHQIPDGLLVNGYLWTLGEEGYKEIDGKGYGYYGNYSDLKKSVITNKLPIGAVHAFYYDSKTQKLMDITSKIQQNLSQEETE